MIQEFNFIRFGEDHDEATLEQMKNAIAQEPEAKGTLCADGHLGYGLPVGGVIASDRVAPAFVGFDIGCGNKAVKTNILYKDLQPEDIAGIMDLIWEEIPFGVGSNNLGMDSNLREICWDRFDDVELDHEVFPNYGIAADLFNTAEEQIGSIGAGNHYVDLFEGDDGYVWIGVHFGSRGFGHGIASGFLNLAKHNPWTAKNPEEVTTSLHQDSVVGEMYIEAMNMALQYAYAGRNAVCDIVAKLMGAEITFEVHNNHNFAAKENHFGRNYWVTRKGATPAFPGQYGFIGGSMGDDAVIIRGVDTHQAKLSLYSAPHGAGRVMSRRQAAGKTKRVHGRKVVVSPGEISQDQMDDWVGSRGIELRGGGLDEAPQAYRRLTDVLEAHKDALEIIHTLRPIGVAMAE